MLRHVATYVAIWLSRVGPNHGAEELNGRYASNPQKSNLVKGTKDFGSFGDKLLLVVVAGLIGCLIRQ